MCTAVLIGWDPVPPPPHLGSYTREPPLVSQDRRHLFATPCLQGYSPFLSPCRTPLSDCPESLFGSTYRGRHYVGTFSLSPSLFHVDALTYRSIWPCVWKPITKVVLLWTVLAECRLLGSKSQFFRPKSRLYSWKKVSFSASILSIRVWPHKGVG